MNNVVEAKQASSVLAIANLVMQDLQNNKPRQEIIKKLHGDVELFKMISLFLYGNKWLTRQNTVTEKGRVWLEMVSDLDLFAPKYA